MPYQKIHKVVVENGMLCIYVDDEFKSQLTNFCYGTDVPTVISQTQYGALVGWYDSRFKSTKYEVYMAGNCQEAIIHSGNYIPDNWEENVKQIYFDSLPQHEESSPSTSEETERKTYSIPAHTPSKRTNNIRENKSELPTFSNNIDWNKRTPKNLTEWNSLSSKLKADWVAWHEDQVQKKFAILASFLEIVLTGSLIYLKNFGYGIIALLIVAAIAAMTITIIFRKLLYKVLRVMVVGLIPASIAVGAIHVMFPIEQDDSTIIVGEVLSALAIYGIVAFLEFKGKLRRMHPKFANEGFGAWLRNTTKAWDDAGLTNKDLYRR